MAVVLPVAHTLPAHAQQAAVSFRVDPALNRVLQRAMHAYRHFDCTTIAYMAPPMEPGGFMKAYQNCDGAARQWKAVGVSSQHVLVLRPGRFGFLNWGPPYGRLLVYSVPVRFAPWYEGKLQVHDLYFLMVKIHRAWYFYGIEFTDSYIH